MSTWAQRVYDVDRAGALICQRMTETGFAFDADRAEAFSAALLEGASRMRNAADDALGQPITRTKTGGFGMGAGGIQEAFFETLRAPVYFRSETTKRPSLNANALQAYAASANPRLSGLASSYIAYKHIRQMRSMFVEKILRKQLHEGRVHAGWQNYGAVSGRWSCQKPNLMNIPRLESDPTQRAEVIAILRAQCPELDPTGGLRSLYYAPGDRVLVKFDYSQLEFRIAAYASGDAAMINACESSDVHAANALILFGKAFEGLTAITAEHDRKECTCRQCAQWSAFRTMAKTSAFAVCYLAEAPTVHAKIVATWKDEWQLPAPMLKSTKALLSKMRDGFATYYEWQDQRLNDCIRTGYVETPVLGRRRQLGYAPKPPEAANFPIQGGAADLINAATPIILEQLEQQHLDAEPVAQVHDSLVFDTLATHADAVLQVCKEVCEAPVPQLRGASFRIDTKRSKRWN